MKLYQILQARWATLAPREQLLLRLAAVLVGAGLLWSIGIAPALRTLRNAPAQHQTLNTQWQTMQSLQAQARALQAQPRISQTQAVQALQSTLPALGSGAQLQLGGQQATLTLKQVPADALAAWLVQARTQARLQPTQARLTRSPGAAPAWDGTLVLTLPAH